MADRVQRRLTTILAADVAGYSRMMREDEDATMASLTACRDIVDALIADHRGRIANTAGDSVLAEFPSVTDGLTCALAFQRALAQHNEDVPEHRRMRFRVGMHLGDVMTKDGDLFGDAVNIAARLEALSEPDGICVSAAVRGDAANRVSASYTDAGFQLVKNITDPVHVFRVAASGTVPTADRTQEHRTWPSRHRMMLAAASVVVVAAVVVGWRERLVELPSASSLATHAAAPAAVASAAPKLLRTLVGHEAAVSSVVFSPDGRTLASGSYDRTIRLWDTATGQAVRTVIGGGRYIHAIAFSPDGSTIASGGDDETVKLWGVAQDRMRSLTGHADGINAVAFSPDGRNLASAGYDAIVKLWDLGTGQMLRTLTGHKLFVAAVAYAPDGQTLASASFDETIKLWALPEGRLMQTLTGDTKYLRTVAFSPDGKTLVSGGDDGLVRLRDAAGGAVLQILKGHTQAVFSVAVAPDGRIASGSRDQTVRLWDMATGRLLYTLTGPHGVVFSVAFSPDGHLLAAACEDHNVYVWQLAPAESARR